MVIKNETKSTILSKNAVLAKTFKQKAFGLIFVKKPNAMIFQTRLGIHTFFMKYPIDILILDKDNKVVMLKKNLYPNKIFLWNPKYAVVIELPEGTIDKSCTEFDDTIVFIS